MSTALKPILDQQTARSPEVLGQLLVDLPFQVESALLVSDATEGDKEGNIDLQQEHVPGEETVAKENASPADQGDHGAQRGSHHGNDEFLCILT